MKIFILLLCSFLLITKINAQQQLSEYKYENILKYGPSDFIKYNNLLFFEASTDGYGREIWVSDGTKLNTSILKDINPGNNDGTFYSLQLSSVVFKNELYFIAADGTSKGEIWKTDGTTAGTQKVTDFLNHRIIRLTLVGDHIFFLIKSSDYTLQVWKSDGTKEGTVLVKGDLPIWNEPTFQGKCNNVFIFTFQPEGTNNSRIWRSDGTEAGTFPLTAEIDGNGSGPGGTAALTQYIEHNNKLYFVSRFHLHETDGTTENTKVIADLWQAYTNLVSYSDVIEVNNKLYFYFFSADNYRLEIWETNLTESHTQQMYSTINSRYFFPSNLSKCDNSLLFCGSNQTGGTSLLSINLADYKMSDIKELADSTTDHFIHAGYSVCNIQQIADSEYFVLSPSKNYTRKGWISNLNTSITKNVAALNQVMFAIDFNQSLFYSKDNQFWKYKSDSYGINLIAKEPLSVFPNPSSDFIFIESGDRLENVSILDVYGRLVIRMPELNKNNIDISILSSGTYILECTLNGKRINKKIIRR
jgi:ELWxxDGT repeat protein